MGHDFQTLKGCIKDKERALRVKKSKKKDEDKNVLPKLGLMMMTGLPLAALTISSRMSISMPPITVVMWWVEVGEVNNRDGGWKERSDMMRRGEVNYRGGGKGWGEGKRGVRWKK